MLQKKGFAALSLIGLLALSGCAGSQDQTAVKEVTDTATENVEHDFKELDEETTRSLEESNKSNEEKISHPSDMMEIEEELASGLQ